MSRPFFSLIIPCYNDGRYQEGEYLDRLLNNLCHQGLERSDLQIITVDDQSPVGFVSVLDKYSDLLDIQYTKTDCNGGPGHSRQCGVNKATGRWICFADHDDRFYPKALRLVKDQIIENKEQYYCFCDFNKVDPIDDHVVEEFRGNNLRTWVHGKFYNLDHFWLRYDLEFPEYLRTHEDIALGAQIDCISVYMDNPKFLYIQEPVYMWTDNPSSVSNTQYGVTIEDGSPVPFLARGFSDFLESRCGIYLKQYEKKYLTRNDVLYLLIPEFMSCWQLLIQWRYVGTRPRIDQNEKYMANMLHRTYHATSYSPAMLKVLVSAAYPESKKQIDKIAEVNHVPTFFEWIDYISAIEE